jgi:hypothetical protein
MKLRYLLEVRPLYSSYTLNTQLYLSPICISGRAHLHLHTSSVSAPRQTLLPDRIPAGVLGSRVKVKTSNGSSFEESSLRCLQLRLLSRRARFCSQASSLQI